MDIPLQTSGQSNTPRNVYLSLWMLVSLQQFEYFRTLHRYFNVAFHHIIQVRGRQLLGGRYECFKSCRSLANEKRKAAQIYKQQTKCKIMNKQMRAVSMVCIKQCTFSPFMAVLGSFSMALNAVPLNSGAFSLFAGACDCAESSLCRFLPILIRV